LSFPAEREAPSQRFALLAGNDNKVDSNALHCGPEKKTAPAMFSPVPLGSWTGLRPVKPS
jgi:hypothetical protein